MKPSVAARPRVRVSKNRKKAWRKHCDINDVEKYLEEKRFEERIGGPIFEKPDDEIFFHHTTKDPVELKKTKVKELGNLKCHQSLCTYSKVQPPVNPQQIVGKRQKRKISAVQDKKLKGILQQLNRPKKATTSERFHDLWSEDADSEKPDPEIKELIDYRDEITRKRPVKVPCHLYQKPSLLPAVEVPHPGASYNPSYEDHQDLLHKAVVIEEKKVKEELHLKRILTDMFPVKSEAPTEQTWVAEMSQGLFDDKNEAEMEADTPTGLCIKPEPVTTERQKSKSQKRKEKERKETERQRILEKQTKHEMNQVFRVRSIMSEIKKKEKLSEKRQVKKEQKDIEKLYQPRTIGRYKFEPSDLEVNLSEELQGSLRELKVDGNIFEDRYKSLQKRNIIEPRIRQKRNRKYKLKVQVKRSHRDFK